MAVNDLKVLKHAYSTEQFSVKTNVNLGIQAGDGIILGSNNGYVDILTDGMPTRGTDVWVGVSDSNASNSASVDGILNVILVGPGTILQGRAKTAANINTAAKLLAIQNFTTSFARSAATPAGLLTINETSGITAKKSSTQSIIIISGDIVKGTLRVANCGGTFIDPSNV